MTEPASIVGRAISRRKLNKAAVTDGICPELLMYGAAEVAPAQLASIPKKEDLSRCKNCKDSTYLLTYLAITTCYRSWPQRICGAIRHEMLQLSANFGYQACLGSHQPVWTNAGEAVLVCDNHHLAQIRRFYALGWSYPYERHDPAIEDVVF